MGQAVFRYHLAVAALAIIATTWAPAAVAGHSRCDRANAWLRDHCGSSARMAASREGTPWRCGRARDWVRDHCSDRHTYRSKPWDRAEKYVPRRPAKQARRTRTRVVYVYYTERPRRCCRDQVAVRYYSPPLRSNYAADELRYGRFEAKRFFDYRDKNLP